MKLFKKTAALIFTLLMSLSLLASCSGVPEQKKEEKTYEGTHEQIINAFYEDHKDTAAGMMVGVFDKNGTVYEGYYGYSNIAEGIKVDENTVIDWGSSTKTMVWVSVMQLWEKEMIDLERDVRDYLPEGFLKNLRYDKPVRMIDLMNHRAGFQEYYTDMFLRVGSKFHTLEEALKLDQPEQVFKPDTITAYSNWGVALAAYIVERISGESFADYVHKHIFEPLGMKDSALAPDLMDNPSVRERRDKLVCYQGTVPVGNAFYYISMYPAGACVSTLKDYIKYGSCFVKDKFPLFERQNTFDVMMKYNYYKENPLEDAADEAVKQAQRLFTEEAMFWFQGSWESSVIRQLDTESEYGFIPVPLASEEENNSGRICTLVPGYFCVDTACSTEEQQAAAREFITFATMSDAGQQYVIDDGNIPAYTNNDKEISESLVLSAFDYASEGATFPMYTKYPSDHYEAVGNLMQQYLAGEIDRAGLAEKIEAYWNGQA